MSEFRLSPEAEAELNDIRITERFWLLARYPWLGRPRDEDLHPGLRSIQARPCVSIRTESGLTPEPRPSGSGQTREKSRPRPLLSMAAYLITFTCYGSYLPGQQGAIDRDHNVPGSRLPSPRPKLRQHVDAALKQAPYEMDQDQRAIVLKAIGEVCHCKCWRLLAAHIRSNHVHTVVDADIAPEAIMNAFKSYVSRALNLHAPGHYRRVRWARHGSTRYPWSPARVAAAVRYVLDKQGDPMDCYQAPERS